MSFISRQTDENMIESAIDNNWLLSLAFFYKLKVNFVNSIIYNYSLRSLANKLNISHNTVRKHISILLKYDLVSLSSGHLKLSPLKSIIKKYRLKGEFLCTLLLRKESTLTEIKYFLYGKIIEKKSRQQIYASMFRDQDLRVKINSDEQRTKNALFSYESLSGIIKTTKSTIKKILEFLVETNIISKNLNIKKILKIKFKEYLHMKQIYSLYNGYFYKDGFLVKVCGTFIKFNYFNKLNS